MPNTLLQVPHHRQQHNGDCLAACAYMALSYLELHPDYDHLLKLLQVKPFGTSARNLHDLTSLGVEVVYDEGWFDDLYAYLKQNYPCIVLIRTADLSYWTYTTDHAVLVVGFDENTIYVNDPMFDEFPIAVPVTEFELAWMSLDYRYGVVIN